MGVRGTEVWATKVWPFMMSVYATWTSDDIYIYSLLILLLLRYIWKKNWIQSIQLVHCMSPLSFVPPRVAKPPSGLHNVRAPQCVQVCCYAERGTKQQQAPVMSVVAGGGLWVAWTSTRIAMMFVYIRLREPEHGGNPLKQTTFSCHVMYLHEWPSSFSHYVPNIKSYIQSSGTGFVANGTIFFHDKLPLRTCFALWNGLAKERQDWKLREEPPPVEVWGCSTTWSGKWWMISWTAGRWTWNCKK